MTELFRGLLLYSYCELLLEKLVTEARESLRTQRKENVHMTVATTV
jgi:hypothetical protein